MRSSYLVVLGVVLSFAFVGCNCSAPGPTVPDGGLVLPDGSVVASDPEGDAIRNNACVEFNEQTTLESKPIDIIFVIDNSGSMQHEIIAVQNNINTNFANIIANAGVDYRVLMISRHGNAIPNERICISQPLSGHDCGLPDAGAPAVPVNTARFFHYSRFVDSSDSYEVILGSYDQPDELGRAPNGWRDWVRPGAFKQFIEITDDNATNYQAFDTALLAMDPAQFGTASNRNYVFHSITGVGENSPVTAPWQPTQPEVAAKCTGNGGNSVNNSIQHQRLSILTGGLRFPICQYTSFDAVFNRVAQDVIASSRAACSFALPQPDAGDPNRLVIDYTSDQGIRYKLGQVASAGACGPNAYYKTASQVNLCPGTCDTVQNEAGAKVDVYFACPTASTTCSDGLPGCDPAAPVCPPGTFCHPSGCCTFVP
jgi:hypothetical protein